MAGLFEAVARFRKRAKSGRSGAQLGVEMSQLRLLVDLIEVEFSEMAGAFARTDEYDQQGSVSPIDWIRFNCHMTSNAAGARVAVGRNLPQLAESAQAVSTGEIGFAHLIVIARTADAVPGRFDEKELLAKARENSPGKLHHIAEHYRHSADAKGYAGEQAEQVENRRLSLSRWEDGSYLISGVLDTAGGAALRTALEPLARKSSKDDDRHRERRLADALVEFVQRAQPAQLQVTTSLETLMGLPGAPAAEMEYSLPISAKTVERLACECSVTRILLGSESQVIDVGRSKRVVSGPGRKALEARDGHCRWPGCDRPAKWSAAHHVVHWIHGGTTDLDNLILLCHRHHWMVHEGNWQIVRANDGRMLTVPPTITFGPPARAPDQTAA